MSGNNPHSHGVYDPGHAHSPLHGTQFIVQTNWDGNGGNLVDGGVNASYDGGGTTAGAATGIGIYNTDINHSHSGGTDGGSSQQNWSPRYVNLIICQKN